MSFRRLVLASSLSLVGCLPSPTPPDPNAVAMPSGVGMLVVEADYGGTAATDAVDPDQHTLTTMTGASYDGDPVLRRLVDPAGVEHLYILGRTDGKLTEVDRLGHVVGVFSVTDPGPNPPWADPYDVAFAPDGNLWITRYAQSSLLVLRPDGTRVGQVDLKAWADPDGKPEMSAIAIVNGLAYVALQRLAYVNGMLSPTDYSSIVAIDTTKPLSTPAVTLVAKLPVSTPEEQFRHAAYGPTNELWISCIGAPLSTPPAPGALVKLDLSTGATTKVLDGASFQLADGRTFPGFVAAYDVLDDGRGFAVLASIADKNNPTSVVEFDPTAGKILSTVWYGRDAYYLRDLEIAGSALLVGDRDPQEPAVAVLDASDGTLLGKIDTRLPPVNLVVLRPLQ